MEIFNKAKVVRLRSHLNKFLVADDNEHTVRQSRNEASIRARWTVEMVEGKSHVIRLKSCYSGKYLTPSNEPFLTGMTGKKVVQDIQANKRDTSIEWEPIKEGELVKLRAKGGKFLRGNGGTPPWRNSVTHDLPQRTATQDWVLWGVDVVEIAVLESQESFASNLSPMSSFSSVPDIQRVKADYPGSSLSYHSSPRASGLQSGMDFFRGAKAVRLQNLHNKYLVADDNQETVRQSRNASSSKARWTVEFVNGNPNAIRLKSCHGLYLTATNIPFLLGMTGKKVQQHSFHTIPDHTTEWEPIKESAFHVKLRTRDGKYLRANGGTPPWRNSITHDVPHRSATQDWVLWSVDMVDIVVSDDTESVMSSLSSFSSVVDNFSGSPERIGSPSMMSSSPHTGSMSTAFVDQETKLVEDLGERAPVKNEGRMVYYTVAADDGNDEDEEESFTFKGRGLEDLSQDLEDITGLDDIIICSRNPSNGKLIPLRLALPPNHNIIHIVVVPSTSKAAREFYVVSS